MKVSNTVEAGLHNLLRQCADLSIGDSLLIAVEDPALGWYDQSVADAVITGAREIGISPSVLPVGAPTNRPHEALETARAAHDCTIYLTRIGDQDRFGEPLAGRRSVMCYIRDIDMLASQYATASYGAFRALKKAVDQTIGASQKISITCPLGTELYGSLPRGTELGRDDVSILRFPLGVPTPVEAAAFSGRVALANFLTPTGSRVYDPASVELNGVTFAIVDQGRISGFSGRSEQIAKIQMHYEKVASEFGIDRDAVHSWHAGIHPACTDRHMASENPDRWSNTLFCNPRFLHFHTCGAQAPAEISWMVLDPTITLDGKALWDRGCLMPRSFSPTGLCLNQWPELVPLFAEPVRAVGLTDQD